jgi:hypothetical protein
VSDKNPKNSNHYQASSQLAKLLISTTGVKKDPYNLDDHQETDLINDDLTYTTPSNNMKQLLKCSSPSTLNRNTRQAPHIIATSQSSSNTPALMLRSQNFSNGNFNAKISAKVNPSNPKLILPASSLSDVNCGEHQVRFSNNNNNKQSPHHINYNTQQYQNFTLNKLNYESKKNSQSKEYYDNTTLPSNNSSNNKNIDLINSMNSSDFSKMINDQAFRLSDLFNELSPSLNINNNSAGTNKSTFLNHKPNMVMNTSSFLTNGNSFSASTPSSTSSAASSPTNSSPSTQSSLGKPISNQNKSLLIQSNNHANANSNNTHTFNKFPVPFNNVSTLTHTTNRIYNKHNAANQQQSNIYSKINDYQGNYNTLSQSQTKHLNI